MHKVLVPFGIFSFLLGVTVSGLAAENSSAKMDSILAAQSSTNKTLSNFPSPDTYVAPVLAQAIGSDQFGNSLNSAELQKLLNDITPLVDTTRTLRPTPGTTFGTPTAYGANWGQAFVGASGIVDLGGVGRTDGSFSVGAGFGNSISSVGVEVSASVTSVSTNDFADSGSFGLKIHKILPNTDGLGIAVGWSNAIDWGDTRDAPETIYGVVSKTFDLRPNNDNRLPLSISLGVGTGSFRSTGAIAARENSPNLFGSLGVVVIPQVSFASSWTGSKLNLGMGIAPFEIPLTFTLGVTDVTNNTVNGSGFNINAGYSITF